MLGLIQHSLALIKKQLNQKAQLQKIAKLERNFERSVTSWQRLLEAYVIEPSDPASPKASIGYLSKSEIKTPESIQGFKMAVAFKILDFKKIPDPLLHEVIEELKSIINDDNSIAVSFLRYRKTQPIKDKSPTRMANFLVVYYLLGKINSLANLDKAYNAIKQIIASPEAKDSELTNKFIVPIQLQLKKEIDRLSAFEDTKEINDELNEQIGKLHWAFNANFQNEALKLKGQFEEKVLAELPKPFIEAYAKFAVETEQYYRNAEQLRTIQAEIRVLQKKANFAFRNKPSTSETWGEELESKFQAWLERPAQKTRKIADPRSAFANIEFDEINGLLFIKMDLRAKKEQTLKIFEADKNKAIETLTPHIESLSANQKAHAKILIDLAEGSLELEQSIEVINFIYGEAKLQEIFMNGIGLYNSQETTILYLKPESSETGALSGLSITEKAAKTVCRRVSIASASAAPANGGAGAPAPGYSTPTRASLLGHQTDLGGLASASP